jgi:hypothetical protein
MDEIELPNASAYQRRLVTLLSWRISGTRRLLWWLLALSLTERQATMLCRHAE